MQVTGRPGSRFVLAVVLSRVRAGGEAAPGESTSETLCLASGHRAHHRQEGEQHDRRDDAAKARLRQAPPRAHAPQYTHCVEDI